MTPVERLIFFGRLPEPGRTKTRLAPALGHDAAARLYQAFLDDLVSVDVGTVERELRVPDRPGAVECLGGRYPGLAVRLQPRGDLGARLRAAFSAAFDEGADHVVVVGTDHPTLPPDYVERAFAALPDADLVLGPTRDGGYYLIGLRRLGWPGCAGLLEDAPWSSSDLLRWTRERAVRLDLNLVETPEWYDVDTPEDLEHLRRDVSADSATGRVLATMVS